MARRHLARGWAYDFAQPGLADPVLELEVGIVDSILERGHLLTVAPMRAGIQRQSQPTIEIISTARSRASRVCLQAAAYRQQSLRELAMNIRIGIKEGIPAVKLPLGGGLVLSFGENGTPTYESNHCGEPSENVANATF